MYDLSYFSYYISVFFSHTNIIDLLSNMFKCYFIVSPLGQKSKPLSSDQRAGLRC